MSRFKELRKKAHLTQEQLISQFNIKYGRRYTAAAISQFENDKRIPETNSLMDFADFYGVSVDYILGRTDDPTPHFRKGLLKGLSLNQQEETSYYTDPDAAAYAEAVKTNPDLRVLFDASKRLTKEDIARVTDMIQRLAGDN